MGGAMVSLHQWLPAPIHGKYTAGRNFESPKKKEDFDMLLQVFSWRKQ